MRRGQWIGLIIILLLFATAVVGLAVPEWKLPLTNVERGSRDTPLGLTLGLDLQGGVHLVYETVDPNPSMEQLQGTIEVIRRRVNEFGVSEPLIQTLGTNRVVVQLPGVEDVQAAKDLIGSPAVLDFREYLIVEADEAATPETTPDPDATATPDATPTQTPIRLEFVIATAIVDGEEVFLTGELLTPGSAQVSFNPTSGQPEVSFQFDRTGSEAFRLVTRRLVQFDPGDIRRQLGIFLDGDAILTPEVQAEIPTSPRITGLSLEEARILAIQLNAGAFPVPLQKNPILERDVDAFLGANALDDSLRAGLIGLVLVLFFMILYYRMNGLVAAVALIMYAAFVLAIFKALPVVLTLSGLAAFVLSFGFAVDANVLIFERMKEELRAGRGLGSAIDIGFNRAWPAIRDGNFTTLIIAAILFWFGERLGVSQVQGFALTLAIGVGLSMLTAIFVTRRFLHLFVGTRIGRRTKLFMS